MIRLPFTDCKIATQQAQPLKPNMFEWSGKRDKD